MRERDLRIDLIKLIATMMIVILHTVENVGGVYTALCVFSWNLWNSFVSHGQWIFTL